MFLTNGIYLNSGINTFKGKHKRQFSVVCPDVKMQKIIPNPEKMGIFESEKGKEAWGMNLGAIYTAFYDVPIPKNIEFEEDREILLSKEPEDAAKWTPWINPKTGRTYFVIKKRDNEDGTKTVRVLDVDGRFIKEKDIVPKKIIQADTFAGRENIDYGANIGFSHGDIVRKHLERNNPIADIETIDITDYSARGIGDEAYIRAFENILERIWDGEKIDVVNCSFGADFKPNPEEEAMTSSSGIKEIVRGEFPKDISNEIIPLLEEIAKTGTRVVFAAGNEGKDYVSLEFGAKGIDVVGSIDDDGSISDFSSARNFAVHYERGRYHFEATKYGINLTGKPGADFSYENTPYKRFALKRPENFLLTKEEVEEYKKLQELRGKGKIDRFEFAKRAAKFKGRILRLEDSGKTFPIAGIKNGANIFYSPERNLLLTTTPDGFLIPYLTKYECKGTSYSAPVRSAKLALNEAMREILEA